MKKLAVLLLIAFCAGSVAMAIPNPPKAKVLGAKSMGMRKKGKKHGKKIVTTPVAAPTTTMKK